MSLPAKNGRNLFLSLPLFWLLVGSVARGGPPLDNSDATGFFMTVAERLLQTQMGLSVTNLPVFTNNTFVYTPAVHRLLQVAANLYDASTNRAFADAAAGEPPYPTVFRPRFTNAPGTNIYITGFVEVTNSTPTAGDYAAPPLILPEQAYLVDQNTTNVYGVPYVIGARKGYPNFNEFSFATISQITRSLQISKPSLGSPRATWVTNVAYLIGISNAIGVEAWNAYTNPYPRALDLSAVVDSRLSLWVTNQPGQPGVLLLATNLLVSNRQEIPANSWTGVPANPVTNPAAARASFQLPVYTNWVFLPDSLYHQTPPGLASPPPFDLFETNLAIAPAPQFILLVTNRVRFFLRDVASGKLLDFVQLDGCNTTRDLRAELMTSDQFGLWNTNLLVSSGGGNAVTIGINNQILISSGATPISANTWNEYTLAQWNSPTISLATSQFRGFLNDQSTNLVMQAPFTPTAKFWQYWTWQANDPSVHYTLGDLATVVSPTNPATPIKPPTAAATNNLLINIGIINNRYQPWGGNPLKRNPATARVDLNPAYKDPMIIRAAAWDLPVGLPLDIRWLGEIHRGTPWQTLYLKSAAVEANDWQTWTGNPDAADARRTQPTNDWHLLSALASLINTNSPRNPLSANNLDLVQWAAADPNGFTVLTNPNPAISLTGPFPSLTPLSIGADAPQLPGIIAAIIQTRAQQPTGWFSDPADIFATPELSLQSPWLDLTGRQPQWGLTDAAYEAIPAQLLTVLRPDSIGSLRPDLGSLQVEFTGVDGFSYAMQSSTDLRNWITLAMLVATNGRVQWPAAGLSGPGQIFFRSVLQP